MAVLAGGDGRSITAIEDAATGRRIAASETGERVVILKHGRPVAALSRATDEGEGYPQAELEGTVVVVGDVLGPVFPEEHWDNLKR